MERDAQAGSNIPTDLGPIDDVVDAELRRYVASPLLPLRSNLPDGTKVFNNPLDWWKTNQGMFPILAQMARIYLAIPATSAPSERVFSVASRLISGRRNRMTPELVGKCLFVSENWERWCGEVDFLQVAEETADDGGEEAEDVEVIAI